MMGYKPLTVLKVFSSGTASIIGKRPVDGSPKASPLHAFALPFRESVPLLARENSKQKRRPKMQAAFKSFSQPSSSVVR